MNIQKKGTFQFCFPGLLGIHRNPKWKEFLKSRESFLKKVPICTLTDLNTRFGGPWNKLQIILVNGTFIMPQKKSFGQKKFWISCTAIFPFCQNGTFEPVHEIQKYFWSKDLCWKVFSQKFKIKVDLFMTLCLSVLCTVLLWWGEWQFFSWEKVKSGSHCTFDLENLQYFQQSLVDLESASTALL